MLVEHPTKQIVEHFESKFVNNEDQPAALLLEEGYSERERKVIIMMIGATGHTLAPERIPQELSRHLIDLMAQQKMLPETLHMLELCNSDDALVVMGSDIQLRLSILAIDEGLHDAIGKSDSEHPPKYFECLLERFDSLVSVNVELLFVGVNSVNFSQSGLSACRRDVLLQPPKVRTASCFKSLPGKPARAPGVCCVLDVDR